MRDVLTRALAALLALSLMMSGAFAFAEEYYYEEIYEPDDDVWLEEYYEPTPSPLRVSLSPGNDSVSVSRTNSYRVVVSGGVPPYSLTVRVTFSGATVWEDRTEIWDDEDYEFDVTASRVGTYKISVSASDWSDQTVSKSASLAARQRETESQENWEESMKDVSLSGDWAADLVAIAQSQVGYQESEKDIRVDSDGKTQGYTRYGAWAGPAYAEWCAIFVGFCLHYANVPETAFPWDASVQLWISAAKEKGLFCSPEGYAPKPGDVVFLRLADDSSASHIGIVEKVEGDKIVTIEGNAGRAVARREYALGSAQLAGYASMDAAKAIASGAASTLEEAAPEATAAPAEISFRGTDGETVTAALAQGTEITIDPAGGSFAESPEIEWDYTDGCVFYATAAERFSVPDAVREGFEFAGWALDETAGAVLTAQWTAEEEPIRF